MPRGYEGDSHIGDTQFVHLDVKNQWHIWYHSWCQLVELWLAKRDQDGGLGIRCLEYIWFDDDVFSSRDVKHESWLKVLHDIAWLYSVFASVPTNMLFQAFMKPWPADRTSSSSKASSIEFLEVAILEPLQPHFFSSPMNNSQPVSFGFIWWSWWKNEGNNPSHLLHRLIFSSHQYISRSELSWTFSNISAAQVLFRCYLIGGRRGCLSRVLMNDWKREEMLKTTLKNVKVSIPVYIYIYMRVCVLYIMHLWCDTKWYKQIVVTWCIMMYQ